MHRFNLTFQGEIQPGRDPDKVKRQFAEILGIEDDARLDACFSGEQVTLRQDLDRKTAADLYHRLYVIGATTSLIRDDAPRPVKTQPTPDTTESPHPQRDGTLQRDGDHIDQKWAVSSAARATAQLGAQDKARRLAAQAQAREQEQRRAEAQERARELETKLAQEAAERQRRETAEEAAREQAQQQMAAKERAEQQARADEELADYRSEPVAPPSAAEAQPLKQAPRVGEKTTGRASKPNLYALSPFRVTPDLRERPQRARVLAKRYRVAAVVALLLLLATGVIGRNFQPPPAPSGALTMATLHDGGLVLTLADRLLLHDRAGVGSESLALSVLGLDEVQQIHKASDEESHFLLGRSVLEADSGTARTGLWRCQLASGTCKPFGPQSPLPASFAVHPFNGMMLQVVPDPSRLRKLAATGEVVAEVAKAFSSRPTLLPRDGLLYSDSVEGPALSVLRYEDNALATQLDEVILLAPGALSAGRTRVATFAANSSRWWVVLMDSESGERGLYQFDQRFGFERELPLPPGFEPHHLLAWGEKLLVLDPQRPELARFSAEGVAEVPLQSDLLAELIASRSQAIRQHTFITQSLQGALWLLLVGCCLFAWFHNLRGVAFKPDTLRGAEPVDSIGKEAHWVGQPGDRESRLRRAARLYLAGSCLLLVIAVILQVAPATLVALVLLLGGPALSLWLYLRSKTGYIGVVGDRLLVVDHRGIYHTGSDARILYRGWFLMVDDVLVYTGPRWLPAFDPAALQQWVVPVVRRGARIDRRGLLVRLVEGRHPLALGAGICLVAAMTALALLLEVI